MAAVYDIHLIRRHGKKLSCTRFKLQVCFAYDNNNKCALLKKQIAFSVFFVLVLARMTLILLGSYIMCTRVKT